MSTPDITVHHLGLSQSERIPWLLEELGIPYKMEVYCRDPANKLAPEAYQKASPTGSAPYIKDGRVVLGESAAITEYIIRKYGNGRLSVRPDAPNYPDYCFWFHWANSSFQPALVAVMLLDKAGIKQSNPIYGFAQNGVTYSLESIEKRLGKAPYLAGEELTAADITIFFSLTTMRLFVPYDLSDYPYILAYVKRVGERPAYQAAMKKGEPDLKQLLEASPAEKIKW